jgi:RNA polymerase sigma-70 factor (ECF subfamily)
MATAESPSTSPSLFRLLALPGSEAAWVVFVTRYTPLIAECCRAARLQPADADEVRSRVLSKLVAVLGSREFEYDPARRFRGYLATTVRNTIRGYWRELSRRPGAVGPADPAAEGQLHTVPVPDPLDALGAALDDRVRSDFFALHRLIDQVRGRVEPGTWRAFWETVVEGRSVDEVAAALGKSAAAVYMAKSRVLRLLREDGGRPAGG